MKNEGREKKKFIINYFEAQLPGVSAMPQPVGSGDDDGEDDVDNDDDVVDGKIIFMLARNKKKKGLESQAPPASFGKRKRIKLAQSIKPAAKNQLSYDFSLPDNRIFYHQIPSSER